jgi:tetratricopeptide (TPR) repeat protein
LLELERVDDALASFRRCNEILGEAHGPDATGRVPCLAGVGTALLDRGEAQPALEPLEHAVAICDRDAAVRSLPRAQALFALARALWASGGDRARARTLAQRAADALRTGGPWIASRRDPIESWLAAHPSSDSPPAR